MEASGLLAPSLPLPWSSLTFSPLKTLPCSQVPARTAHHPNSVGSTQNLALGQGLPFSSSSSLQPHLPTHHSLTPRMWLPQAPLEPQ